MASEGEIIATLAAIFKRTGSKLLVGIGDDGAVAPISNKNIVMSSDLAVAGVHFKREWSSLSEIGAKIVAANLADIYAMGGEPKYLLVSAGLPNGFEISDVTELAQGIKSEADLVNCEVVGGDISKASELFISIAAVGEVTTPTTRSGAKIGDKVFLSNLTGPSAAGLAQLKAGISQSNYVAQHKKPVVNYALATNLLNVNSLTDTSDGLLSECNHLAKSSEVGIVLEGELISKIPGFTELNQLSFEMKVDVWSWILAGGEDHAFLGTNKDLPNGVFEIGSVISGSGVKVNGASPIKDLGWRHF